MNTCSLFQTKSSIIRLRFFWFLPLILTIFLLVFYVFQISQITQESYLSLSLQEQIKELSQANENLEINFTQNNSLESLEKLAQDTNYEKQGKIHYIQILGSTVAAK